MTSVNEPGSTPKKKTPSDSAFKQQRLPAWQPILTAGTVLPTFFLIGLAFIPIGISLLHFSHKVKEQSIDYTNCKSVHHNIGPSRYCSDIIQNHSDQSEPCICQITFTLEEGFNAPVYMYYGLTNFYQNHRRYVKSRDDNQLLGQLSKQVSSDCESFAYDKNTGVAIVPCGAIANSLFNDELTLFSHRQNRTVPVLKTGIAWPSDKSIKFKNPVGNLTAEFYGYAKPPRWKKRIDELDLESENNNAFQNEDLIVWMRTAALPTFRKLYRKIDHSVEGFEKGLPAGTYNLTIFYSYSVTSFEGTKRMILSTTSLLGGKNPFLGYAYIVVGSICLILGVFLLIIHIKYSKSSTDMININPTTPYH